MLLNIDTRVGVKGFECKTLYNLSRLWVVDVKWFICLVLVYLLGLGCYFADKMQIIKTKGEEEIDLAIYFERNLPFSLPTRRQQLTSTS